MHFSLVFVFVFAVVSAQTQNRAPQFLPGGDMARFALYEDTPAGAAIYKLLGSDPEQSKVHFSISGEYFTVDRNSGVVTLLREVDREKIDQIEVIISITDEGVDGAEPNTVSLRRVLPVIDVNDNAPTFGGRPYAFRVPENAKPGTTLYSNISLTDADLGANAEVALSCVEEGGDSCQTFGVAIEKLGEGQYVGLISLLRPLDYETATSYSLTLRATDMSSDPAKRLSSTANVVIDVIDVQDQAPTFINAPYSATVPELTPPGTSILTVRARDGDLGSPRRIVLSLQDDTLEYFSLSPLQGQGRIASAVLVTSERPLDREDPSVLQTGGIYTFNITATEMINDELPGDVTFSLVTIVITDVDDQLPVFNQEHFEIDVSEDIGVDTPLPGLQMVAWDADVGDNSRYHLRIRDVSNARGRFSVHPSTAVGRTPVVVRVARPLDFDVADASLRTMTFDVVATVDDDEETEHQVASSRVTVHLLDSNDNAPVFPSPSLKVRVREDVLPGTMITNISATDRDSGQNADIRYAIRGFGAEKFGTSPVDGGIFVTANAMGPPLDYETQKSYSLTFEARDGGGKVTAVNLLVEVEDVNDNVPQFEQREYSRTVREGATSFQPKLFVRATDLDSGDGGRLFYSLESTNGDSALFVEPISGEVQLNSAAAARDTPRGQYELVVRATDAGTPPLHNDTRVLVRVGVTGNQRPIFRNFNDRRGGYRGVVAEDAAIGTEVARVDATDPDGQDGLITYHIAAGDKDNFVIDHKTGVISVSPDARLDLESGAQRFDVLVHAVDAGVPYRETAVATVVVNVTDVNNKPPVFTNETYVRYVSERVKPGESLLFVTATDPDSMSRVRYTIVDPIKAFDKTGARLSPGHQSDIRRSFSINETTGEIKVTKLLNHNQFSVAILTVQAKDTNATEEQVASVEVSIYIQAFDEKNPIFIGHNWTPTDGTIRINVAEELPTESTLLTLEARDPITGDNIRRFEIVRSTMLQDFDGFLSMEGDGNIVLNRRLDFEALNQKTISLKVKAISNDGTRSTEATVLINVEDTNDNAPVFSQKEYKAKVLESAKNPTVVLTVSANDSDAASNVTGYGTVRYSLSGEHSALFVIDKETGMILVAPNVSLDREKQPLLRFNVVAADTPQGGSHQKKSSATVIVEVLDVNDNAPIFTKSSYSAVVPETVPQGSRVASVSATDPDLGPGGQVSYEMFDEGEAKGLFSLDSKTGEISTRKPLSGKGRTDPYVIVIRAHDLGTPSKSSDVALKMFIGDVFSNDGVPTFVRPTLHESARVSEDAVRGTPVYQVIATDADDPGTPNGRIEYRFLDDGSNAAAFRIDPSTGLISTAQLLDRESRAEYRLQLVIRDQGEVPQQATRELKVTVEDVDDHKPVFKRSLDEEPISLTVKEEVELNTTVGIIAAKDEDIGENGMIDYLIIAGNEDQLFRLTRTEDNKALISVAARLDRETNAEHLLTVKCFKMSAKPSSLRKPYNRQDPSERQVRIKIEDVDDNAPSFTQNNFTIGVRLNVPLDTQLLALEATDADSDATPVSYFLVNATFFPLTGSGAPLTNQTHAFRLDKLTGELRTAAPMLAFVDGFFQLNVTANNTRSRNTTITLFVLRDRDLLKFVFGRAPADVRKTLDAFRNEVQNALAEPVALNVYDTQIHAKKDGSLDFSSTSSCFQLVGKETYGLKDMETLLQDPNNEKLTQIYNKYNVQSIQRCSASISKAETSWTQVWVLTLAALVGLGAFIATVTTCCLFGRYKKQTKRAAQVREGPRILGYVPQGMGGGPPTVIMSPPPSEGPQMYDWAVENLSNYHTHSTLHSTR